MDRFGAFGVNRLGLNGTTFPLTITVSETGGVWTMDGTAARACDLVDVLAVAAQPKAAVLNLHQASWLDDDLQPVEPSEIARRQGVEVTSRDISWAAVTGSGPNELLVMEWADLHRFLDGWSHYGIDILDVEGPLSGDDADELALATNTHGLNDQLLLDRPRSRVFFSGHDDCYLHVEGLDASLPVRVLTRLLALLAGSALLEDNTEKVTVGEPDLGIASDLLKRNSSWTGVVLEAVPGQSAVIGLAATQWKLGSPLPADLPFRIGFSLETGQWSPLRGVHPGGRDV